MVPVESVLYVEKTGAKASFCGGACLQEVADNSRKRIREGRILFMASVYHIKINNKNDRKELFM
jgi:hypothetical protein